jgi:hypothetical protein
VADKVPDLEQTVEAQKGSIRKLRIDNAFLTQSDVEWHDPEAALALVDLSEVEIKDDGSVKGLKEALAALAEKKPYLVKQKEAEERKGKRKGEQGSEDEDEDDEDSDDESDEDDEDEDDNDASGGGKVTELPPRGTGVSGTATGSKKRKRKPSFDDAALMARYNI